MGVLFWTRRYTRDLDAICEARCTSLGILLGRSIVIGAVRVVFIVAILVVRIGGRFREVVFGAFAVAAFRIALFCTVVDSGGSRLVIFVFVTRAAFSS